MVEHSCNPSTFEIEALRSRVQSQLQLLRKLEANLGYMRACLKKTTQPRKKVGEGKEEAGRAEGRKGRQIDEGKRNWWANS